MNEPLSFRNHISTVNAEGKRIWIYPKKQTGKFYTARTIVSVFQLLFLFGLPLIKVNGHPLVLFNIFERKFILFGIMFGPHDFYLFVLVTVIFAVGIILFTAVYGRIFCGWVCPQTVFMEMVYRKIEYLIEGDSIKQKAMAKAPLNAEIFLKKLVKQVIFFGIAFLIANIFVAYVVGIDKLREYVVRSPAEHLSGFIAVCIFSGLFYFVFSWFREQACTIVCPYGRLQSVLLDQNSIVVAYDNVRGEPRGKFINGEKKADGDCIDCHLCVAVCPTGIDIRNGTQLECVNCTSCIDACDSIMDKIKMPRGLIRFASINSIKNKTKFRFTPRIILYSVLLVVLIGVFSTLFAFKKDLTVNVFRAPGKVYQEQPDNKVSNLYMIKFVNSSFNEIPLTLKIDNPDAELRIIGKDVVVLQNEVLESEFLILLSKDKIKTALVPLKIEVYSNDKLLGEFKTSFIGPVK